MARSGEDPSKYLLALKMCEVRWGLGWILHAHVHKDIFSLPPPPHTPPHPPLLAPWFVFQSALPPSPSRTFALHPSPTGTMQALETIVSRPCSFAFMPEETSFVQVAKELAGSSVLLGGS